MTLLGMVDWTSLDRAGKPIASVVPLFETSNSALRKIKADVEFPSEGRVFWFKAEGIKKDELIYFNVEENSDERYQFKVSDHHVAIEVRDFRKLGSPEDVRLALLSGLKFAGLVSGRSLLWCGGDLIVGPVQLVTLSSGLFTFEHPQKHKIACYLKKEIEIIEVPAKPFKRYALSENGSFVPNFYVDWGDDEDVAKRAIKWAVARASQDTSAINLTQKQIREASDYLAKLGGEAEFKLERYRLDRTLKMFADVRRADSEAAAAVEELQKVPEIAKELEQLRESIRSATEQDVRESLRVELERLETARQEQAVIEADTKAAKENLQNLRTEKLEAIDEVVFTNRRIFRCF